MIGLGGQLGVNALGAFELGTLQAGAAFVPHRGRPHSAVSRTAAGSGLTRTGLLASAQRTRFGSLLSRTRPDSTVSSSKIGSEVSDE